MVVVVIAVSVVRILAFGAVGPLGLEARSAVGACGTKGVVGACGEVDGGALLPKSQQHSTSQGKFTKGVLGHTWYRVPSPE